MIDFDKEIKEKDKEINLLALHIGYLAKSRGWSLERAEHEFLKVMEGK